jgi:hypothetical protein
MRTSRALEILQLEERRNEAIEDVRNNDENDPNICILRANLKSINKNKPDA